MFKLNSIMIGSSQPQVLAEFYEKIIGKPADSTEGGFYGWVIVDIYFSVGEHSKVTGSSKEPSRIMVNFETPDVMREFQRLRSLGATVIKEPYGIDGMQIATLADPDGNYFQLMSPWVG